MDAATVNAMLAGFVAAGTSLAAMPLLFKGDLRFRRELEAAVQTGEERAKALTDQNERQARTIEKLEAEMREQYRTNGELNREVVKTVQYLQQLSGLATKERRGVHER